MVGRLTKWAFVFQEECDTTILHVDIIYCLCKIKSISIHGNRTVYISKNDSKVTCKVTTIIKNISLWARDHHSFSPKHTDFYSNYWTYPAIIYVRIRISIYMDYTIWYIYIKHKKKIKKIEKFSETTFQGPIVQKMVSTHFILVVTMKPWWFVSQAFAIISCSIASWSAQASGIEAGRYSQLRSVRRVAGAFARKEQIMYRVRLKYYEDPGTSLIIIFVCRCMTF